MGRTDVDLHLHTWYSDGATSPASVVDWAAKRGLTMIAITDHDGVDGIDEAALAAAALPGRGMEVIPGIELSTEFDGEDARGTGLHILGYHIDRHDRELTETCEEVRRARRNRNERLLQRLSEAGYPLELSQLVAREGQDFIGKPNIARAMVKQGYIADTQTAFRDIFSRPEMRAVKKKKISSSRAVQLIKAAGGIPVLAHPGLIRHIGRRESGEFFTVFKRMLDELCGFGVQGLECDYAEHSPAERETFAAIAREHGLAITRGSDYHGDDSHGSFDI